MEVQNSIKEWIEEKVFFSDSSNKDCHLINVDTRDFKILGIKEKSVLEHNTIFAMSHIKNKQRFIFSFEDIKNLVNRLYEESGSEREWRHFCFESNLELPNTDDWRF